MAKDDRSSAESRLRDVIQKRKTGAPVESAAPAAGAASPRPAPKKPGVKPKIKLASDKPGVRYLASALVVEPNKRISSNLINVLKSIKVKAESVTNGADAQKMLEVNKYLIIIIERGLPDIAGFNLSTKLRTMPNGKNAVIIITSEDRDPSMKDQALMVDADDYLPKPISTGELTETVKFHLLQRKKVQG